MPQPARDFVLFAVSYYRPLGDAEVKEDASLEERDVFLRMGPAAPYNADKIADLSVLIGHALNFEFPADFAESVRANKPASFTVRVVG
jgi:hypothetical protein